MAGSKYAKYIVTGDTRGNLDIMPGPSPEVVKMMEEERKAGNYIDRTIMFVILDAIVKGSFYAGCEWVWELKGNKPMMIESAHSHDFDEIIGLVGCRRDNPHDLGGEVEFWMEDEQQIFSKACLIFIPRGIKHCPLTFRRIDSPIFMFEAANSPAYTKIE